MAAPDHYVSGTAELAPKPAGGSKPPEMTGGATNSIDPRARRKTADIRVIEPLRGILDQVADRLACPLHVREAFAPPALLVGFWRCQAATKPETQVVVDAAPFGQFSDPNTSEGLSAAFCPQSVVPDKLLDVIRCPFAVPSIRQGHESNAVAIAV